MYNLSKTLSSIIIHPSQAKRMLVTSITCYQKTMQAVEHKEYLENLLNKQKHISSIDTDITNKIVPRSIIEFSEPFREIDIQSLQYSWLPEAKKILRQIFKKDDFLPLQLEAIAAIMEGKDCLIIKSTGGGKSLCYQLPSLLIDGFCIVISPLLSLMDDQIMKLKKLGIPAIAINNHNYNTEFQKLFDDTMSQKINYKLIYITPEQYAYSKKMKKFIKINSSNGNLSFITLDEIHCVKDWSESFRKTYTSLKRIKNKYKCPIVGLSATVNQKHIDYLEKHSIVKKPVIIKSTVLRKNLTYQSIWKEKNSFLQVSDIIKSRFFNQLGIVYCLSIKETEEMAKYLTENGIPASAYNSNLSSADKKTVLQDWLEERVKVVVGTNAFGMGIDKGNVRFIIHHSIPSKLINFIQETGRAGRDRLPSTCLTLFNTYDVSRRLRLGDEKIEDVLQLVDFLYTNKCKNKIIANLFNENFDQDTCKRNCDSCNTNLEHIHGGSEKLLNAILSDAKIILKNSKENITQKKLSTLLWRKRRHWSLNEIDMFLTTLLLRKNLTFYYPKFQEQRQSYIQYLG